MTPIQLARTLLAASALCAVALAAPAEKSALRVLYVGPDPDDPPEVPSYITHADRHVELVVERMPAFQAFLEEHFEQVTVVKVADYDASMSDEHDVTVFDAQPKPIDTVEVDGYPRKVRLPPDFDSPAVTVGEVGPFVLGRFGFGLKIDHL